MERRHFETLVAMYDRAPVNKWFRPALRIPEEGRAEIEMAVREDFHHAARAIHGAVYFKALDDATFFAVQSVVTDFFVVTSSFQLYFLRPVSEGHLLARGQVVSRSKRLYIAEACSSTAAAKKSLAEAEPLCQVPYNLAPNWATAERSRPLRIAAVAFMRSGQPVVIALAVLKQRNGENLCRRVHTLFRCSDGSACSGWSYGFPHISASGAGRICCTCATLP